MSDTRLYTVFIPTTDLGSQSTTQGKNISSQSTLTTDLGSVQGTGSQPGTTPISGAFKGEYADLIAKELSELGQAPNYTEVPLFTDDDNPKNDGYVTVESFDVNPANPRQTAQLWEYNGSITEEGTARSHFRSIETQPTSVDNPFDLGSDDLVALPATQTKVRWYDETGQVSEPATVQSTISGRFIDINTFSPNEPSFDNPSLLAKIPYEDEGKMDARVWDDQNRVQFDADGVNSWQKVFSTGHNFAGDAIVENGLLQLTLDEDGESMSFAEWDDTNSEYSSVALGTSDWVLFDHNFTRLSPTRTEGQMRFRNTTDDSTHTMNFQVNRASNRVLFFVPPNEDPIPSGLETKLDPIAEEWTFTTQSVQTTIPRSEVNN